MSVNNIKTQLQSYKNAAQIDQAVKEGKLDKTAAEQLKNFFGKIDTDGSGDISAAEWEKSDAIIEKEIKAQEQAKKGKADNNNASNIQRNSNGDVITYPKEGETFKKTAERLGFKEGTPEYNEFLNANKNAGKRNWFKVGEEVIIPKSIENKAVKEEILNKEQGDTEVKKWEEKQGVEQETKPAQPKSTGGTSGTGSAGKAGKAGGTNPTSGTGGKGNANYPKGVQDRLNSLKQSGDKYEISGDAQKGYTIKVTDGKYMQGNKIGEIVIKYDKDGNMVSQTNKYNSGKILETTYAGGKKTVEKAKAAPQKYQDMAATLAKRDGGNARVEYNNKTNKYSIIQTNTKDKNVKEMRTVVNEKAWQQNGTTSDRVQNGIKDAWNNFKLTSPSSWGKAKNAMMKNSQANITTEDYFESKTTTYTNGKIVKGTYEKGKIKKNETIREADVKSKTKTTGADAANSATTVNNREKLNSATDISFSMPSNAPPAAKSFASSLTSNKEKLMRELNIDSDTYNMLAQTAMGIARQETNFGEKTTRQTVKDVLRAPSDSVALIQDSLGLDNKSYTGTDWSQGITQLKYTLHTQDAWVKQKMKNLGITNETQLNDPETSAVATMVVLAKLNQEIDSPAYQKGIKAAQGTSVELKGYELDPKTGAAKKTADGSTKPWTNEISRQDVLCAFWNGGARADVKNGTFKPSVWTYSNNVKKYTHEYKLNESQSSRQQAVEKSEATRVFANMDNNGEMGGIVFMPAMYTDSAKHKNTPAEINQLKTTLTNKGIDSNLINQLTSAMQNGEIGFDFGLKQNEIDSLTGSDIKLLLKHLDQLKRNVNVNTGDGISTQEASTLRSKYGSTIGNAEDNFRVEYLNNHSRTYNATSANPKVLRERSTNTGSSSYVGANGQRRGFQHERAKGVNINTTSGRISSQQELLAQSAHNVVSQNPTNKSGQCLTGVKSAMSNAGIDVSDMAQYGTIPKYAKNWFSKHSEMFTPVEYVSTGSGTARSINASDIQNLPAGYIVIWEPEEGSPEAGHIAITNGNGQGYADATDNLGWGVYSSNNGDSGKGEHGHFKVFKLSDNWKVDPSTGKLVFNG